VKLAARLVLAGALAASFATVSPASATECTQPGKPCTAACHLNGDFGTGDLRPIVCYS
jgi:hypothetical protein